MADAAHFQNDGAGVSSLSIASNAVEAISRGAPGRKNVKPNAIRITRLAIEEGSNKTIDAAARAIRERLRKEKIPAAREAYADALAIVLALSYEPDNAPVAA